MAMRGQRGCQEFEALSIKRLRKILAKLPCAFDTIAARFRNAAGRLPEGAGGLPEGCRDIAGSKTSPEDYAAALPGK